MIVVRVELHSAITGEVTELARAHICNDGSSPKATRGNYIATTFRGRSRGSLNNCKPQKSGNVTDYPRLSLHVWNLVARCLKSMGYA